MNNKKYYYGVAIVIVLFGAFAIYEISKKINNKTIVDDDRHLVGKGDNVKMVKNGKAPKFSFTDQNGKTITNKDYDGKVYVVEFFFTTCPSICPLMNRNMVKIQNEFITKKDFGIVSITIDPEHDTPEVLKEYAERYGVTSENWHFLTGDKKEIYELANNGFHIAVEVGDDSRGSKDLQHSGLFALIDKSGNLVSRIDNFGNPVFYYSGLDDESVKQLMVDISIQLRK